MPSPLSTPLSSGPRAFPRIKFIWGSSDVVNARWRLGLFGFYDRSHGFPYSGLAISGRGLLRWSLILGVVGYVGGAAAIARWFARNPYNQIRFTDVLTWPARRDHIAQLRGRAWLAQGKDALKAKRWAEGAFLLRKGLDACPEDFEARLVLAQFQLLGGQRSRALALLVEGAVDRLPPAAWREQFFALAKAGEDWASTLLFCDRCLPRLGEPAKWAERQTVLAHKLAALIALDRAGEALALAEAEGDGATAAVKFQRAEALLVLKRAGDAADFLERWLAAVPAGSRPDILKLQVRALREAGRLEEMDRALTDLRAMTSARPEPMAFAVEQKARAGREADAALSDYLFRFGNTPANLQLVAQPLAEIPDVPRLQRVVTAAIEHGFAPRPFRVQLAVGLLRAGDWPALARVVNEVAPAFAKAEPDGRLWFEWMQCLSDALTTTGVGGTERLVAFLQTRAISLEAHRLTVAALRRAGREEAARDVLAVSCKLYAESPWLHAQQAEVEHALAAAPAVSAPTPAPIGPPLAAVSANWRDYFRDLDAAIAKKDWSAADHLVANVRRARQPPAWLAGRDADLQSRELRVTQARHDTPAFRLATRLYLNGSPERENEVLAFARELRATGERDDAMLLLKAVLERPEDHPAAEALLAEWQPKKKIVSDGRRGRMSGGHAPCLSSTRVGAQFSE